jgi:hypothetical protein
MFSTRVEYLVLREYCRSLKGHPLLWLCLITALQAREECMVGQRIETAGVIQEREVN